MSKRRAVPAASFLVLAALAGAHASAQPAAPVTAAQDVPAKARIFVEDNYFEPRSTEIVDGGQVNWKWRGHNRHSVRFTKVPEGASRKSASARAEGRWKRKFHRVGVYRYVCKVWSGMRGSITVRPKPDPKPTP